jgi:hypothetical protein
MDSSSPDQAIIDANATLDVELNRTWIDMRKLTNPYEFKNMFEAVYPHQFAQFESIFRATSDNSSTARFYQCLIIAQKHLTPLPTFAKFAAVFNSLAEKQNVPLLKIDNDE